MYVHGEWSERIAAKLKSIRWRLDDLSLRLVKDYICPRFDTECQPLCGALCTSPGPCEGCDLASKQPLANLPTPYLQLPTMNEVCFSCGSQRRRMVYQGVNEHGLWEPYTFFWRCEDGTFTNKITGWLPTGGKYRCTLIMEPAFVRIPKLKFSHRRTNLEKKEGINTVYPGGSHLEISWLLYDFRTHLGESKRHTIVISPDMHALSPITSAMVIVELLL